MARCAIALAALGGGAAAAQAHGWNLEATPITSGAEYVQPAVAMSMAGTVTAIPLPDSGVAVATRASSGAWSTVSIPTAMPVGSTQLATNAAGDVVVGWQEGDDTYVSERPAGGTFGTPQHLDTQASAPELAVTDQGEVLAAWNKQARQGGDLNERVRYGSARLGAPLQLDGESPIIDGNYRGTSLVAARRSGKVALVWSRPEIVPGGYEVDRIAAVQRDAGGAWSTAQEMGTIDQYPHGSGAGPAAAIDDAGAVAVAWSAGDRAQVFLARTSATGGTFGAPEALTPAGQDDEFPRLAMASSGALVVAYEQLRLESNIYQPYVSVMRVPAPGDPAAPGAPEELGRGFVRTATPALLMDGASAADVLADQGITGDTDGAGDAVSAWTTTSWPGPRTVMHVQTWDATGPALGPLTGPAAASVGQTATFAITASDVLGSVATYRWTVTSESPGAPVLPTGGAQPIQLYTFQEAGTYTVTAAVDDAAGNTSTASQRVTVAAATVVRHPKARSCHVPSLTNLTVTRARRRLAGAGCALGRVYTPKRYKHTKGLVVRAQGRPVGQSPAVGAHVSVTLALKPKATHKRNATGKAKHKSKPKPHSK